jgi:hypothetical protein
MPPASKASHGKPISSLRIAVAALVGVLFLAFFLTQKANLNEYYLYFTEDRIPITFQFSELSEDWTEQTLHERFSSLPLTCQSAHVNPRVDRACAVDVKSHNGVPAMFVSFFFASGHLQEVAVGVPLWSRDDARDSLVAALGRPSGLQLWPHDGVRLVGWELQNGSAVFLNRDMHLMPPYRNAIYWRSSSACKADGCFVRSQ